MIDLEKLDAAATHAQVHGYLLKWDGSEIRQLVDRIAKLEKDAGRLNFMQEEALDARCVEIGEDGYGWQIMSHFMAEPKLRMVGESHDELGLRQAIDTAMESKHG